MNPYDCEDRKKNKYEFRIVKQSIKTEEQIEKERAILRDFFQMFSFTYDSVSDPNGNLLVKLFESVSSMLKCRLQLAYENTNLRSDPIDYKSIIRENKEFLKRIKEELIEYSKRPNMSYLDEARCLEIEEILNESSGNVINGYIYHSKYQDALDLVRKAFLDQQFRILKSNRIHLGSEKPSKGSKYNVNKEIALSYYDILNDVSIRREFLLVMSGLKNVEDAHLSIKKVINKIPKEYLLRFMECVVDRDYAIEAFLLMYLVADHSKDFRISDIEEHYDEIELEEMLYSAKYSVEENIDNMYLSRKLEIGKY